MLHLCCLTFADDEIAKKIRTLRIQYVDEVRKIKKSQKSGAGSEDIYVPKWKFFSLLDFMSDSVNVTMKETTTNLSVSIALVV